MTDTAYGVAIPAHNAARTLGEAIESVLAQTVAPSAVVVVDDGSTDHTAAIARSFGAPVEVIGQHRRGPAAATDAGFAAVGQPLIAGLDADDVWLPEKAEAQLAALANDPGLDGVFCGARIFAHGDGPRPGSPTQELWGRSALMIRRAALDEAGPVDHQLVAARGEMIDWIARARDSGLRLSMLPAPLVGRRIIAGSLSHDQDASALLPAVRAALARKRGTDGR